MKVTLCPVPSCCQFYNMQFKQCPVSSQLERIVSSFIISFLSWYFFRQGWIERVGIFLRYLPVICMVVRSNHFLCNTA